MTKPATFTFARGNAGKVRALPLYAAGALVSLLVRRSPERWVFGSAIGPVEGALAVLRAAARTVPNVRIDWLATDRDELEQALALGVNASLKRSLRGFWLTLRAHTAVVTHGFGDVNRYGLTGARRVQLWHGVPLKKLHLDSPAVLGERGLRSALMRSLYRRAGRSISLFPVASEHVAERITSAFGLRPHVAVPTGDPRDDALLASDAAQVRQRLRELLNVERESKLVLFAPTWRDGEPEPILPSDTEWGVLEHLAEQAGFEFVVRPHPLSRLADINRPSDRVHVLTPQLAPNITDVLAGFDVVITDYSSIALDYSLRDGAVLWFAPDLDDYAKRRGLYDDYEALTEGEYATDWPQLTAKLLAVLTQDAAAESARLRLARLREQFFAHTDPNAADRVIAHLTGRTAASPTSEVGSPATGPAETGRTQTVFFESFYGKQIGCNPAAIDREIARRLPHVSRIWSVADPALTPPAGAQAVRRDSTEWQHARDNADVLIVNDWLGRSFSPKPQQFVLQTWHGTMLKRLALERPNVSLRTKLAISRESRKWSALLSQNSHSTRHFRSSYAYRGPVWQAGYPRNDALHERDQLAAKAALGIAAESKVLVYAPTWRDDAAQGADLLNVAEFAARLPRGWMLVTRGHSRVSDRQGFAEHDRVIDASQGFDAATVIASADLFVTDYSSMMFDASVSPVRQAFFAPDLERYRDAERGFTFDFEQCAPGPITRTPDELLDVVRQLNSQAGQKRFDAEWREQLTAWRNRFNAHDDGTAAKRVVQRMIDLGILTESAI